MDRAMDTIEQIGENFGDIGLLLAMRDTVNAYKQNKKDVAKKEPTARWIELEDSAFHTKAFISHNDVASVFYHEEICWIEINTVSGKKYATKCSNKAYGRIVNALKNGKTIRV